MTLEEFMRANGLDDDAMAEKLKGCTAHAVKKWRYRERTPRPAMQRRIAEVTGGEVTANDFVMRRVEPTLAGPAEVQP